MLDDVKAAKRKLLQLCAGKLVEFGFDPRVGGQAVYKDVPYGKWAFHLNFRDRVYGFEAIADVAVRHDRVEDLVNYYPKSDLAKESERKKTFTVGTNFRVAGSPPIWEIEFDEEIPKAADSIMSVFRTEGIPFLEYNSTLEGALQTLTTDLAAGRRTLAIAFLLKHSTFFDRIAQQEVRRLEKKNDAELERFKILEAELRGRGLADV